MLGGNFGIGVVPGGTDINAPVVTTHWWCPVPGAPVSSMESFFGCPSVNGIAPGGAGSQPSAAGVETILNLTDSSTYMIPTVVPNPAVGAGTSTLPAPYDCSAGPLSDPHCAGYDAALAASTAAQKAAQDAANVAAMNQTLANIRAAAQARCPDQVLTDNGDGTFSCPGEISLPSFVWIAAGVGVLVLLATRGR